MHNVGSTRLWVCAGCDVDEVMHSIIAADDHRSGTGHGLARCTDSVGRMSVPEKP